MMMMILNGRKHNATYYELSILKSVADTLLKSSRIINDGAMFMAERCDSPQ